MKRFSLAIYPATLWLLGATFTVVARLVFSTSWPSNLVVAYACITVVASLLAFVIYWWDKRAAMAGRQRTPEKTLHTIAVLGGWPGAVVGQQVLRHKSQKTSFRVTLGLTMLVHILIFIAILTGASKVFGS